MTKLTKEEAILRTMTLWTELARTGAKQALEKLNNEPEK